MSQIRKFDTLFTPNHTKINAQACFFSQINGKYLVMLFCTPYEILQNELLKTRTIPQSARDHDNSTVNYIENMNFTDNY